MDAVNLNLEQMRNVDIRTIDRDLLVDIRDVIINQELSREERLADFISQIKNPYCYRCQKAVVKVSFADTSVTLEEKLEQYLKTL